MQSRWTDIDGPLHYLDSGGSPGAPVLVCVHGLGGSAQNWAAIAPLLTSRFRLLAPDLAGHGLTRSQGRSTTVQANQQLLHRFIETVAGGPVLLMGNSMGGMISLLEAGERADWVRGLILVDPALPFVPSLPDPRVMALFALYMTPGIGRAMAAGRRRLSPEAAVAGVLGLCCADPSRVPADVVARHVDVARQRAGYTEAGRDFSAAMRSVLATAGYLRGAAYRRQIGTVTCPVLLIHGAADRLVPVTVAAAAARTHPSWSVVILSGVGHVPQLEAPAESAAAIGRWLTATGLEASGREPQRMSGSNEGSSDEVQYLGHVARDRSSHARQAGRAVRGRAAQLRRARCPFGPARSWPGPGWRAAGRPGRHPATEHSPVPDRVLRRAQGGRRRGTAERDVQAARGGVPPRPQRGQGAHYLGRHPRRRSGRRGPGRSLQIYAVGLPEGAAAHSRSSSCWRLRRTGRCCPTRRWPIPP